MDFDLEEAAPRRQILKGTVAIILQEAGYHTAKNSAIETLTEMMQSLIIEMARSSKHLCELAGRTEPLVSDVALAMVEMGFKTSSLQKFATTAHRTLLSPLEFIPPHPPMILKVGEPRARPSYIPDYLPAFPDAHTYIRTPATKDPEKEYRAAREKLCFYQREIERALTKYIAKTGATESVFPDDDKLTYPLIANKPKIMPYLDALCPKDHDMEENYAAMEDLNKSRTNIAAENTTEETSKKTGDETSDGDAVMDNPYLREIKMPKLRVVSKKNLSVTNKTNMPMTYFNWQDQQT